MVNWSALIAQRGLNLLRPEAHIHSAIERESPPQMIARLFTPLDPGEELAELAMVVGEFGTHSPRFSQRNSLAEMGLPVVCGAVVADALDCAKEPTGHYLKIKIIVTPC